MKTQIKTKDLLKLIDPVKDGIEYQGQKIQVNLNTLDEYVNEPKKNGIFQLTDDVGINFYKNTALYILNSDEPAFISIDLDKKNPIESGIFEYVKAIYKKENQIFISLPETGDNSLFIKSKDLVDLKNNSLGHVLNPEKAQDIEYAQLSSIFLQTKKYSEEEKQKMEDKVTEKDRFFWKEDGVDLYANKEWMIDKVKEILKGNKYAKDSRVKSDFSNLIRTANNDFVQSDEFKLALLELKDNFLNEFIIKHPKEALISIDFSKPLFQEKLMQNIKNKEFSLLKTVFEKHANENYYDRNPKNETLIDFSKFFNEPEVIEIIKKEKPYIGSYPSDAKKHFCAAGVYSYLNEENKRDPEILEQYISNATGKNMNGEPYLDDSLLMKLPLDVFEKEEVMRRVLPHLRIEDFYEKLKKNNITNSLLTNKDFLLSCATNLSSWKTAQVLHFFYTPENITKDYFIQLIEAKPSLFEQYANRESEHKSQLHLKKMVNDIDVIMAAEESGYKIKNISINLMAQHLITQGTPEQENFKVKYIISNKINPNNPKYIYTDVDDIAKFKEKYAKLEYQFFKVDDWHFDNKQREKALFKIKDKEQIKELLEKMYSVPGSFNIDYKAFYKAMNPLLQKDFNFLNEIGVLDGISYKDLVEPLQYNKKAAIYFAKKGEVANLPIEFFNDIKFSLDFAQVMDSGVLESKKVPLFISKFFENQGVSSNYYQHLKAYISMNSLKETLDVNEEKPVNKKIKI